MWEERIFPQISVKCQGRFMKALSRVPIFNYSTIATTLLIPTKSLEIKFRKKYLTAETIFELESILAWVATHNEVQSLVLTCIGDEFIQGFSPEDIKNTKPEKLKKLYSKLNTIVESFLCLPQTVVVDMKKGTRGIGLEISLAADIRIAQPDAIFCFDQLSTGLTPSCGIFSFLKEYLNQNVLRSLLLSGVEFNKDSFIALGGWCEITSNVDTILSNIFKQAPVARIQAKHGLYGIKQKHHQELSKTEKKILNTVLLSKDYTKDSDFMTFNEYKETLNELNN